MLYCVKQFVLQVFFAKKECERMFAKDMHMGLLLDFYGEVLPERTYDMLRQYYEDDLSLSEIADAVEMTRQGVRHFIKKGEEELLHLEECLGLAARFETLKGLVDQITATAGQIAESGEENVSLAASKIISLAKEMKETL